MVEAIRSNDVQVKTVAFSAPMTTALESPLGYETTMYLKEMVHPHVRNFCYKTDPVPRGYANLSFILALLEDIKKKFLDAKSEDDQEKIQRLLSFLKEGLVPWALEYLEGKIERVIEQATKYRHVGKVIYYHKECAGPEMYVDHDHDDDDEPVAPFRDLSYTPSEDDPIAEAIDFHMFLVKDKGLGYHTA